MENMVGKIVMQGLHVESYIGSGGFGDVYKAYRMLEKVKLYSALKRIVIPKEEGEYEEQLRSNRYDRGATDAYFRSVYDDVIQEVGLMHQLRGKSQNIISYGQYEINTPNESPSENANVDLNENANGDLNGNGNGNGNSNGNGNLNEKGTRKYEILIEMEYLTSLDRYSLHHELTVRDVLKMGRDITSGLAVCHSESIMHRDVKTANIFVNANGMYKLGDFGLAKKLADTSRAKSKVGTKSYMAPEIVSRKTMEYGKTIDMYSLGLVMYEALNQWRMPFFPASPAPITNSVIEEANYQRESGQPLPPPRLAPALVSDVVLKACAPQPEDRFQKADEMKQAIEHVMGLLSDAELDAVVSGVADLGETANHQDVNHSGGVHDSIGKAGHDEGNYPNINIHDSMNGKFGAPFENTENKKRTETDMERKDRELWEIIRKIDTMDAYREYLENDVPVKKYVKEAGAGIERLAIKNSAKVLYAKTAYAKPDSDKTDTAGDRAEQDGRSDAAAGVNTGRNAIGKASLLWLARANKKTMRILVPVAMLLVFGAVIAFASWPREEQSPVSLSDEQSPDSLSDEQSTVSSSAGVTESKSGETVLPAVVSDASSTTVNDPETAADASGEGMDGSAGDADATAGPESAAGQNEDASSTAAASEGTSDVSTTVASTARLTTASTTKPASGATSTTTPVSTPAPTPAPTPKPTPVPTPVPTWSIWSANLPSGITEAGYDIERKSQYRFRQLLTQVGAWSGWQSSDPSGAARNVESQYQVRTRKNTTSTASSLAGWTQYGSPAISYGDWSGWSTNAATASSVLEVQSKDVGVITYKTVHNYSTWKYVNAGETYYSYASGWGGLPGQWLYKTVDSPLPYKATYSGHAAYSGDGALWFNYTTSQAEAGTVYHKEYQTRTVTSTYNYWQWGEWSGWTNGSYSGSMNEAEVNYQFRYQEISSNWGDWSAWSDNPVDATSTTDLQTMTLYRYIQK